MTGADVLIAGLAAARLSRLAAVDEVAEPLRHAVGLRALDDPTWDWIDRGIGCRWCSSVWAAAAIGAVHIVSPRWGRAIAGALAASYVAGWVAETEPPAT